jgi:hypothetical protein
LAALVDQHVDAPESVNSGLGGRLCVLRAGDVQPHRRWILRLAESRAHSFGIAAGGDYRVPDGERPLGGLDTDATTGPGDEPHALADVRLLSSSVRNVG